MANWKSIKTKIKKTPKAKKAIDMRVKETFTKEKEILIRKFLNHPVTKEIEAGTMASNISGTLNGYGNLFTFIGFSESDDPITRVLNLLTTITKLKTVRAAKGLDVKYDILFRIPSNSDFKAYAPLPWESGKSWVLGIERGISGFGSYMYDKMNRVNSRSGKAFQAKKPGVESKSYTKAQKIYDSLIKK